MIMRIFFLIFMLFSFLLSSVDMEGFYEGQYGRSYESDIFNWNIWEPNLYLETRLYGDPVKNSNFYIKFYSDKDYSNSEKPLAVLAEGHIAFSGNNNNNGFFFFHYYLLTYYQY